MNKVIQILFIILILIYPLSAQNVRPSWRGGYTKSLGQPMVYKPYLGVSIGSYRPDDDLMLSAQFRAGIFRDLMSPVVAALGISAEGYWGNRNENSDGGARAFLEMPIFHLAGGVDYNVPDKELDFIFRLNFPTRRSGIFGNGTDLRLEWLPGRGHSFNIGVGIPIFQSYLGKTRAKRDHIKLTAPGFPDIDVDEKLPELEQALANIRDSGRWINRLTSPYFDYSGADATEAIGTAIRELKTHVNSTNKYFPQGRNSEAEVRLFHREVDRAFSIAVSGRAIAYGYTTDEGKVVAVRAKEILLQEILIPYNRLLGQIKKKDTIKEYAVFARGSLVRWLHTSSVVPDDRMESVRYVFEQLIAMIEENRRYSRQTWGDSRLVWIPLQYVFLPEDHDSQEELDRIIEQFVNNTFSDGNRIWYIINEQFQREVHRQIHAAREYHVLWIHDIDAFDAGGDPDTLTFLQIKDSYLAAMTRRVREYDDTGKLPVYIIFLDQFFYEANGTRTWMRLLEKPLDYTLELSDKTMQREIAKAQAQLRKAVKESRLLQAEVAQYGDRWLKNLIKIHVNITNPADLSFYSRQVIPILGLPDIVARDHRKISFYDISEKNPYRGEAMITGMGIGEHYAGATWDDRGILISGPAALYLKDAARQLLYNQGFEDDEIPYPLLAETIPANYAQIIQDTLAVNQAASRGLARAMQLHNETGFHWKYITVFKAIMYTLAPKGCGLLIPDSLWNSAFWASLVIGNSLRGGWGFIIAPSLECAPSAGFPQMSRAQELFARLIVVQNILDEEIKEAGGNLNTALYDPEVDVADIAGKISEFRKRWQTEPQIQYLLPFHPSVHRMLDSMTVALRAFYPVYLTSESRERRPKLHAKTNLFISIESMRKILSRPEFAEVFKVYIELRASQAGESGYDLTVKDEAEALYEAARTWLQAARKDLTEEELEKLIVYFSVGTMNQDYRGKMLDGEAVMVLSGWYGLNGLMDTIFTSGLTKRITTLEELQNYLPQYSGLQRWVGNLIKFTL